MATSLTSLRAELAGLNHVGRLKRMLELGRQAQQDPAARGVLDVLQRGDVYQRRLALFAQSTMGDGGRVLAATRDPSRSVRQLAFTLVPEACDDHQALDALQAAFALRREPELIRALARAGRRAVIDRYLDWLAERPGVQDFADFVPFASPAGLARHLPRALARPSRKLWQRLARNAAGVMARFLAEQLRAVSGEPDVVIRQLIERHTPELAERAPDEALELLGVLLGRGIRSQLLALKITGATRPLPTLELIERHGLTVGAAVFARSAPQLAPEILARVVRHDPELLGPAKALVARLGPEQRRAVAEAWSEVAQRRPAWGMPLLVELADPARRLETWSRWSVAMRDADGVIALSTTQLLPPDLREREGRRHLEQVVALATRPAARVSYARFLSWGEAEAALKAYLGHPEGAMRGVALEVMLSIPGLRPAETTLPERALAMVTARKNEQDPVRAVMLRALASWPRAVWRAEHVPALGQLLRDALDAGDLSQGTAQAAEALLLCTFRLDPGWGGRWLATFIQERGMIYDARLGVHLSDEEVRSAAPHLLAVAERWSVRERVHQLAQLAESLGARLTLVPGLAELVERAAGETVWGGSALALVEVLRRHDRARYEAGLAATLRRWFDQGWVGEVLGLAGRAEKPGKRQPPLHPELLAAVERIARGHGRNEQVATAVAILRLRAFERFESILGELLRKDESYVALPVIHWHLHKERQDLLGPFLGLRVIRGRFATGNTAWLLPFSRDFHRWTPEQNTTFAQSLAAFVRDKGRDTPTVWSCLPVLAALDSAPMDALAALAEDPRPAVQERAIRVMARCDQGQCVPALLRCLGDARARIAIYGFRKAVKDLLPARALEVLGSVPMGKVTVAKEIVRLYGELRAEPAYQRLVELDGTKLHRDVRIALLRALWDHLDREPTWEIYGRAVSAPDWVMAARLGDIPADRLTTQTDARLSALLGRVLERPEPEARIDLLQRAAALAVRDPERSFLTACAERLTSLYDDEVVAAAGAIMQRSTEHDLERLPGLLSRATRDARCLHVAVGALLAVSVKARVSWTGAIQALEGVLATDPRWTVLRVRCAAAALEPRALADHLSRLGEQGLLRADALLAAQGAVALIPFDQLETFTARLQQSSSPEARRVALASLVRDAGPERGWSPERLARLEALQADPAPLVAGAALAVFPPRSAAG